MTALASNRPGAGTRRAARRWLWLTAGAVAAVVALKAVFDFGDGLEAPRPETGSVPEPHGHIDIVGLLVAFGIIISLSRAMASLVRRVGQPHVIGEIVAGILLGPSVLGLVAPGAAETLFPASIMPFLEVIASVGLIVFMFLVGLDLELDVLRERGTASIVVSQVSTVVTFIAGSLLALVLYPTVGSERSFLSFALFMGSAMSVTAFPVLARILVERDMTKTRLGVTALTCAAVEDINAWMLLAISIAVAQATSMSGGMLAIVGTIVITTVMIFGVRPLLARALKGCSDGEEPSSGALVIVFTGMFLSAAATSFIGIHAVFGAFLFGAIMPRHSRLVEALGAKLADFTQLALLPLFFAFSGLRTDLTLLGGDLWLWFLCALVFLTAVAGKFGGAVIAGRLVGFERRETMALSVLLNCRGLTELVVVNIGYEMNVIPPSLFAMLVIMALSTTMVTTPWLSFVLRSKRVDRTRGDDATVVMPGPDGAPETALHSARSAC